MVRIVRARCLAAGHRLAVRRHAEDSRGLARERKILLTTHDAGEGVALIAAVRDYLRVEELLVTPRRSGREGNLWGWTTAHGHARRWLLKLALVPAEQLEVGVTVGTLVERVAFFTVVVTLLLEVHDGVRLTSGDVRVLWQPAWTLAAEHRQACLLRTELRVRLAGDVLFLGARRLLVRGIAKPAVVDDGVRELDLLEGVEGMSYGRRGAAANRLARGRAHNLPPAVRQAVAHLLALQVIVEDEVALLALNIADGVRHRVHRVALGVGTDHGRLAVVPASESLRVLHGWRRPLALHCREVVAIVHLVHVLHLLAAAHLRLIAHAGHVAHAVATLVGVVEVWRTVAPVAVLHAEILDAAGIAAELIAQRRCDRHPVLTWRLLVVVPPLRKLSILNTADLPEAGRTALGIDVEGAGEALHSVWQDVAGLTQHRLPLRSCHNG
mmetsp:Transcript_14439/g.36996  ORF Transcript_14439/g.36996 Transcript_14439/m.36996 type:complete len:440 (-) Transcript_14439:222-1541(-)